MGAPDVRPLLRGALDAVAAALLSSPCAVCGRVALSLSSGAVCDRCWGEMPLLTPPLCPRCGGPLSPCDHGPAGDEESPPAPGSGCVCGELPGSLDAARAVGPYEGALGSAVQALKYERRRSIAAGLARLARQHCGSILDGADAAVPVPLHARRHWSRGFNQSDEIARHLPLPVWRVLRRTRHTAPQAALTGRGRLLNVRGAFAVRRFRRRRVLVGACVVLVDDVSTTGATLGACADALKAAGVREVRALTMARTLRQRAAPG